MKFQITFGTINDNYEVNYENLEIVEADSEREAVEFYYAKNHANNYFPYEDNYICDADGWVIAYDLSKTIKYKNGYYGATSID